MRKRTQPASAVAVDTPPVNSQPLPTKAAPPDVPRAFCGECGLPQRDPFGTGVFACINQHMDAPTVSAGEADVIRARDLGHPVNEPVDVKSKRLEAAATALVETGAQPTTPEVASILKGAAEVVETISNDLKQVMAETEEFEAKREEKRRPTDWDSAHDKGKPVEIAPEFMSIIKTLVVDDPMGIYEKLEAALVVGDKRADYGSVMKHLDEAESNARMAHRLWQSAIIERKRWELDNQVVFAAMWGAATRALQNEKAEGKRAKMITDADVEMRLSIIFPDQYRAQEIKRLKAKSMVDSMQNLADLWASRCKSLQTILSKQR